MPSKLKNPAKKRTPVNYSLEKRVTNIITEYAQRLEISDSEYVNQVLKTHLGIVD